MKTTDRIHSVHIGTRGNKERHYFYLVVKLAYETNNNISVRRS